MTPIQIQLIVNGKKHRVLSEPCRTLLDLLREDLSLHGAKEGCGQGDCGACVVLMDEQPVNACLVLAAQADGASILTVEGLARDQALHPLQKHFMDQWAFQCGFCTPGMLMSCYALLLHNPDPGEAEIREAVSGNLCRCTSYQSVVEAVRAAAAELRAPVEGMRPG